MDDYKCAECGEIFEKEISDKEAMEESAKMFGRQPESELSVICDDCFKMIFEN